MVSRRAFLTTASLASAGLATTAWTGGTTPAAATAAAPPAAPGAPRGVSWRSRRLLPSFRSPLRLEVADIRDLPGDEQLLLTTLQGAVNRRRPEIYLLHDDADEPWLSSIKLRQRTHSDPLDLVSRYRGHVTGAVVYDPDVPDSINVATTLAGQKGAVVATAELAKTHGLAVVEDLRGRFSGEDKTEIYRWQLENLWPDCEQRLITAIPPTRVVEVEGVSWTEVAREEKQIRDSSNRDTYTIDLSAGLGGDAVYVRFSDAFTDDGWGGSVASVVVSADGAEIANFKPGDAQEAEYLQEGGNSSLGDEGNRFTDGGNYAIYRFSPPEGTSELTLTAELWNQYLISVTDTAPVRIEPFVILRDYIVAAGAMVVWLDPNGEPGELLTEILESVEPTTPYLGWFSNDVSGEWGGVDLASTKAVEVFAADFFANGTVLGGIGAHVSSRVPPMKRRRLQDTVYLTLTIGEGDNLQYCQRHMRALWDDPHRGDAPVNWTVSPVLLDAAPLILRHYQRTATDNDLLVCGPSGAGYTYGGSWPQDDFEEYAEVTGRYLRDTGMDTVYAYNNRDDEGWLPMPQWVIDAYRRHTGLKGIMQCWDGGGVIAPGKLPVIGHLNPAGDATEYKQGLDDYIGDYDGTRPLFISGGVNAWNWTPTDVAELYELVQADDRYTVVLADTFFDLLRRVDDPQPSAARTTADG